MCIFILHGLRWGKIEQSKYPFGSGEWLSKAWLSGNIQRDVSDVYLTKWKLLTEYCRKKAGGESYMSWSCSEYRYSEKGFLNCGLLWVRFDFWLSVYHFTDFV